MPNIFHDVIWSCYTCNYVFFQRNITITKRIDFLRILNLLDHIHISFSPFESDGTLRNLLWVDSLGSRVFYFPSWSHLIVFYLKSRSSLTEHYNYKRIEFQRVLDFVDPSHLQIFLLHCVQCRMFLCNLNIFQFVLVKSLQITWSYEYIY